VGDPELGGIQHESLSRTFLVPTLRVGTEGVDRKISEVFQTEQESIMWNVNRRQFLGAGLIGTLGLALSPAWQRLLAADGATKRAKACILIWLNGGPSHIDTFDPKPGSATNGPFEAIDTQVAGMRICQHLPKLAEQAKHLALVRTLTSREQDHDRAFQYLHTGNQKEETVEYPSLGAVVARSWSGQESDLPAFVSINGSGGGPGFFGVDFAPLVVGNLDAPVDNVALPEGVDDKRMDRRLKALDAFNKGFAKRAASTATDEHTQFVKKAVRFRSSPALKAFDLTAEKPEVLQSYGADKEDGAFGKACVMARRLVENGVRFVEVTLDGWDTHADNFTAVEKLLCQLDPAFSSLVTDLSDRGKLDETLIVCMGEFGRTPTINDQKGRDHWSDAFSMVLAGGGIKGGQVIGETDAKGEQVKDRPVTVPDLYATLLKTCGLDGSKTYRTPEGRPIKLADKGKVVKELLG
jgi:uncharacterized protein (DUF1501 family)